MRDTNIKPIWLLVDTISKLETSKMSQVQSLEIVDTEMKQLKRVSTDVDMLINSILQIALYSTRSETYKRICFQTKPLRSVEGLN